MAAYQIKKDADYFQVVEIQGVDTFDSTTWTTRCMARDRMPPTGQTWPDFIPTEPLVFSTAARAGEPMQIEIRLTATQTGELFPTAYEPENRFPLLDIELTPPAGDKIMTKSQTVEIVEAQTF